MWANHWLIDQLMDFPVLEKRRETHWWRWGCHWWSGQRFGCGLSSRCDRSHTDSGRWPHTSCGCSSYSLEHKNTQSKCFIILKVTNIWFLQWFDLISDPKYLQISPIVSLTVSVHPFIIYCVRLSCSNGRFALSKLQPCIQWYSDKKSKIHTSYYFCKATL